MTLDLSLDDFAAQREALIQRLAKQYGVDPSLITLEARAASRRARVLQSGGLELTITIATSDGSGNAVDISTIEEAAAAVDATTLATTISEVTVAAGLPPVTVTALAAPKRATAAIEVPFSCPKGKWCTAGLVVDCPLGTYNPLEDQDFATACILCPENSYTAGASATSRADCKCQPGFYDGNASQAIDQDLVDGMVAAGNDPIPMVADVVQCHICPVGSDCAIIGATLEELPLVAGYFRLDRTTYDVRECPDAKKNCSTTFGTALCESASGCQGGNGEQCAPGLMGIYCEKCKESEALTFYRKASEDGVATCVECGDTLPNMMLTGAGALVALVLFIIFVLLLKRFIPARKVAALKRFNESFTPKNKLKIIMGAYQISTKISSVYEVSLPRDVNKLLDDISSLVTFGIQGLGVDSTPLECLGLGGYFYKLVAYMLLPPIVISIVVVYVCISTCRATAKRRKGALTAAAGGKSTDDSHGGAFHLADSSEPEREETFFEKTLPAVLSVLFILYPMVTKVAFDGFPCYWFADGTRGWLRADVSIECGTEDQAAVAVFAWLAVGLYPIGIWVFCAALLMKASTAILDGKETPLTRAIAFLYREYEPTAFWWELMEMLRKFLLVGLFIVLKPGSIEQLAIGTIFSATYLMVQLQAAPYKKQSDDFLAAASSFSLVMVFFCSVIYKYAALTGTEVLQEKMSIEQQGDYIVSSVLLSGILMVSVLGSILFAALLTAVQIITEIKNNAKLRRLKYLASNKWVELPPAGGGDPQAFHLFLSHAWPAAQDRMRIVKARFLEALPSCRTFLDVDDLKSGSGTAEVDKSECILVFCTGQYFEKKNSLKELYRAVVQRRPILAMLEPDATQEGGLNQAAVEALITNKKLDKFKLRKKWKEWGDEGELLPAAFDHAPDEVEVRAALFATPPVEWNRLPHFQDVTIRLIAQNGILHGSSGELYLQGEAAMGKIPLPLPLPGREYHLFCSPFNAGAKEFAEELKAAPVFVTTGKKASATLTYTTDVSKLASCDHMLVLLDSRTFTSGEDTAKFVEDMHEAMRVGVHLNCIHEFPSVVGPPRFECEFGLFFGDDWTPAHLTGGPTNLYKEIAFALKGVEWRQPGLVAVASKLAGSAAPHKPISVQVPDTYVAKKGPNRWRNVGNTGLVHRIEALVQAIDFDRDFIVSANELYALLSKARPELPRNESDKLYREMCDSGFDTNGDGQISVEEFAQYWVDSGLDVALLMGAPAADSSSKEAAPLLPPAPSLPAGIVDMFSPAPAAASNLTA